MLILAPTARALDLQYVQTELFFETGQYELSETQMTSLDRMFPLPSGWIIDDIVITARADVRGDEASNYLLSKKRADQTYRYLKSQHLDLMTYTLLPLGEEDPLVDGTLAENRKVEVTIRLTKPWDPPSSDLIPQLFSEDFQKSPEKRTPVAAIPSKWKAEEAATVTLDNVEFYSNSTQYAASSKRAMKELLSFMQSHPEVRIRVEGHTNAGTLSTVRRQDARELKKKFGSLEGLSLERAKAIRNYLTDNGVDASRVEVKGWGSQKPLHLQPQSSSEEAANRRIEVVVLSA